MSQSPQPEHVIELCQRLFESPVRSVARFPTGLCHYMYDVVLADGRGIVVRMATDGTRALLKGGLNWSGVLRLLGIPLPALIAADAAAKPFAYMVIERLPGTDLGNLYPTLTAAEKRELAYKLAEIQLVMATLPNGKGYGDAHGPDEPSLCHTWKEVLNGSLVHAMKWTKSAGIVDCGHIAQVERRISELDDYVSSIAPIAFLGDITTKNVLIDDAYLSHANLLRHLIIVK